MPEFINGYIGGILGVVISHPIDTCKSRVQSGLVNTFADAVRLKHFYRGITAPLVGVPIEKSIVFGFYNLAREQGLNIPCSGAIGGFMSTIIVTPIEYIKINRQTAINSIKIRNIYKGLIPTMLRESMGFCIYFTSYEYLNLDNKSLVKTFLYGGLAGLFSWIFIYPIDLVKTQQQTYQLTVKQIITAIYTKHGTKGFYRGFHYSAIRAVPLHGGVFLGYEISKKYLDPRP